jgi:hypothetical protein
MSLSALKNLSVDRLLDIDEAVSLSAYARGLETEYGWLEMPVPEWLEKSTNVLREEIARRTRQADLAKLKDLEAELDGYKSVGERRDEARRRLTEIQKKLGIAPAKAGR